MSDAMQSEAEIPEPVVSGERSGEVHRALRDTVPGLLLPHALGVASDDTGEPIYKLIWRGVNGYEADWVVAQHRDYWALDDLKDRIRDGRWMHRDSMVRYYAWGIPSEGAINAIVQAGPIIEVGAGAGYWAYEIDRAGGDIIATDLTLPHEEIIKATVDGIDFVDRNIHSFDWQWYPIKKMDGAVAAAMYPERALLIVWPSYDLTWAHEALAAYTEAGGQRVFYVGEGEGGCTADDTFHDMLDKLWDGVDDIPIPQWWGIHDRLLIYERKK